MLKVFDVEVFSSVKRAEKMFNVDGDCTLKDDLISHIGESDYKEYQRYSNIDKQRYLRFKERVSYMLTYFHCAFLTLTFRNDVLDSTSEETRRRYVSYYLHDLTPYYVANIDYGDKTQREHYHALIAFVDEYKLNEFMDDHCPSLIWCETASKKLPYLDDVWSKKYGWGTAIRTASEDDDKTRLAKYITKLSSHAYKLSTKGDSLVHCKSIYGDGFDTITRLNKWIKPHVVKNDVVRKVKSKGQELIDSNRRECYRCWTKTERTNSYDLKDLPSVQFKYQMKFIDGVFVPCKFNEWIDSNGVLNDDLPF